MKTSQLLLSLFLSLIFIPIQAQWNKKIIGNGTIVTETRNVSNYDKIILNGNIEATIISGDEGTITLEGDENILAHIEVFTKKDVLKIKSKDYTELRPSKNTIIHIIIPVKEVSELEVNGSGGIKGDFSLKSDQIKLNVNGSGDIEVAVNTKKVIAAVTGSGDIDVSGKSNYFNAVVTGSGDIDGEQLSSNICNGKVIGSGDIKFYAEEELDAKIVGSGDIKINKSVKRIKKKIVGSGDVTKK